MCQASLPLPCARRFQFPPSFHFRFGGLGFFPYGLRRVFCCVLFAGGRARGWAGGGGNAAVSCPRPLLLARPTPPFFPPFPPPHCLPLRTSFLPLFMAWACLGVMGVLRGGCGGCGWVWSLGALIYVFLRAGPPPLWRLCGSLVPLMAGLWEASFLLTHSLWFCLLGVGLGRGFSVWVYGWCSLPVLEWTVLGSFIPFCFYLFVFPAWPRRTPVWSFAAVLW